MSAKYTFLAWETPVKDASTKLALLQLANNADDNGFSYYSISKMADSCDMSQRSFMRKIKNLEELKVLTVERRSNRPSLYSLVGDEMGVTICHLQDSEVTTCHAEVTTCHLVGDSLSHDPNSTPNNTPESTGASRIDYNKVMEIYNENMPHKPIKKMSDSRKKLTKKFFDDTGIDMDKFEGFVDCIANSPQWAWTRNVRVGANGVNYQIKTFDYYMTEDNFIKAWEE